MPMAVCFCEKRLTKQSYEDEWNSFMPNLLSWGYHEDWPDEVRESEPWKIRISLAEKYFELLFQEKWERERVVWIRYQKTKEKDQQPIRNVSGFVVAISPKVREECGSFPIDVAKGIHTTQQHTVLEELKEFMSPQAEADMGLAKDGEPWRMLFPCPLERKTLLMFLPVIRCIGLADLSVDDYTPLERTVGTLNTEGNAAVTYATPSQMTQLELLHFRVEGMRDFEPFKTEEPFRVIRMYRPVGAQ